MPFFHNASSPIMGLLLVSNGLLCWFRNYPGYLLAPLNDSLFLVGDDLFVVKVYLVTSVDLVRVMWSRHSYQLPPRFCGRQWRVMKAIEGEKFLFLSCLWRLGFRSEFNVWWRRSMERGHVAYADWEYWWHDPLGFPLLFSFLGFLVLKTFHFSSLWFFFLFLLRVFVLFSLLVSATIPILLWRLWPYSSDEFLRLRLFRSLRYATSSISQIFSSRSLYKSLIFSPFVFYFCVWYVGHLGLGIPFHG